MKQTKLRQNILNQALIFSEKGQDTFSVKDLFDKVGTTPKRLWSEVYALHRAGYLATLGGPPKEDGKFRVTTEGLGVLMEWRNAKAKESIKA